MTDIPSYQQRPGFVAVLWAFLITLFVLLTALSIVLIARSGILAPGKPSDETLKAVWAFVGVALGAAITLVGALLTEQNSRRTAIREELARATEERLNKEAEERLQIDTVARLLQLMSHEGVYAPRAVVAGAISTLVELRSGVTAYRILGELWQARRVDTDTAVSLIDRLLREGDPTEDEDLMRDAVYLLSTNADQLSSQPDEPEPYVYNWPQALTMQYAELPGSIQDMGFFAAVAVLLSRDLTYWSKAGGNDDIKDLIKNGLASEYTGPIFSQLVCSLARASADGIFNISSETVEAAEQRCAELPELCNSAHFASALERIAAWRTQRVQATIMPSASLSTRGTVTVEP